jgi:hypothetical protein
MPATPPDPIGQLEHALSRYDARTVRALIPRVAAVEPFTRANVEATLYKLASDLDRGADALDTGDAAP